MNSAIPLPAPLWRLFLALCLAALALPGCAREDAPPTPKAVNGVLDLRDWDFQRDGPVEINGDWAVQWHRLPADLGAGAAQDASAPQGFLPVPGTWTGKRLGDRTLPAEGYATYRLRVLMQPGQVPLAVRTETAATSFVLYVDGRPIASNGRVGSTPETSAPEFRNLLTFLPDLPTSSEWTLAVSNFDYRKGGLWDPVELGPVRTLITEGEESAAFDQFLMGSLLIMALYHLVLFAMRRKDRTALWFGLFCLDVALRTASVGEREIRFLWDSVPFGVLIRLEFITFFLCIVLGYLYMCSLFPEEFSARLGRVVARVGAATILLTCALPVLWASHLIDPYQYWTVGVAVYGLGCIGVAALHRRDGSYIILAGAAVLVAADVNDFLFNLEIIHSSYLFPPAVVVFTFAQSVVLSRHFVRATVTAETLSGELEQKVDERTQQLAAKNQQLEATIADLTTTRKQLQQLGVSVRIGADYVVFPYSDVHYLTAREGKTVIHTRDREHEVPRPLKEIETLLSDEVFQRIHRQCIVNVTYVANMVHIGNGGYIAVLRGRKDAPLPVSRVHAPLLKQRLGIVE